MGGVAPSRDSCFLFLNNLLNEERLLERKVARLGVGSSRLTTCGGGGGGGGGVVSGEENQKHSLDNWG